VTDLGGNAVDAVQNGTDASGNVMDGTRTGRFCTTRQAAVLMGPPQAQAPTVPAAGRRRGRRKGRGLSPSPASKPAHPVVAGLYLGELSSCERVEGLSRRSLPRRSPSSALADAVSPNGNAIVYKGFPIIAFSARHFVRLRGEASHWRDDAQRGPTRRPWATDAEAPRDNGLQLQTT
jgi:hypothetical protein